MEDDKKSAVKHKPKLIHVPANTNSSPSAKLIQLTQKVDLGTIHELESLLQQAKAGELIGMAYVAMYKRRSYIVSTTGEAHRNPTFTLGMVQVLSQRIASGID